MDNDKKAVGNQKVFVQLKDVMDLQKEYLNAVTAYEASKAATAADAGLRGIHRTRVQTYERVIRLLGLPLSVPLS